VGPPCYPEPVDSAGGEGAIKALLDDVSRLLKPKVVALMQLRNAGAGLLMAGCSPRASSMVGSSERKRILSRFLISTRTVSA
jgi:hypothetical protein